MFNPEMAAAGLFTVQGVACQQFAEFKEVGHSTGIFQLLVELGAGTGDLDIFPELLTKHGNLFDGLGKALFGTGHTDIVPHDLAQVAVELGDGPLAVNGEKFLGSSP